MRVCLGLWVRDLGGHWVPRLSWTHHLPAALRVLGLGLGKVEAVWVLLQPLSSCASSLTTSSVSTGHRAPASLGRRARAGQAAPGVSQHPTSPPSPWLFYPLPPLPLFPLSLGLSLTFRAGRKPGRTSSFLSLAIRGGHHDLLVHAPKPQLLPRVLTPECVGRRLVRKSELGLHGVVGFPG